IKVFWFSIVQPDKNSNCSCLFILTLLSADLNHFDTLGIACVLWLWIQKILNRLMHLHSLQKLAFFVLPSQLLHSETLFSLSRAPDCDWLNFCWDHIPHGLLSSSRA